MPLAQPVEFSQPTPAEYVYGALTQHGLDNHGSRLLVRLPTGFKLAFKIRHGIDIRAEAAIVGHEQRVADARGGRPHNAAGRLAAKGIAACEGHHLAATRCVASNLQGGFYSRRSSGARVV